MDARGPDHPGQEGPGAKPGGRLPRHLQEKPGGWQRHNALVRAQPMGQHPPGSKRIHPRPGAHQPFTYGGETLSLAATVATINKLKNKNVHAHIEKLGTYLIEEIKNLITKHDLSRQVSIIGYPFKSVFNFADDGNYAPLELKTYFQQECARRGVLFIGYHLVTYAHKKKHIDFTLDAYDQVMSSFKNVLRNNKLMESLAGTVVTQIFKNVGDRSSGISD